MYSVILGSPVYVNVSPIELVLWNRIRFDCTHMLVAVQVPIPSIHSYVHTHVIG